MRGSSGGPSENQSRKTSQDAARPSLELFQNETKNNLGPHVSFKFSLSASLLKNHILRMGNPKIRKNVNPRDNNPKIKKNP